MVNRLKANRATFGFIIGITFVYSFFLYIGRPIGCLFERFLGISCPGCGMTSAWYHLIVNGDLEAAFYFHPLFFLTPIIALILFVDNIVLESKSKALEYLLLTILIIFVIVYVLRMTGVLTGFDPLQFKPIIFELFK